MNTVEGPFKKQKINEEIIKPQNDKCKYNTFSIDKNGLNVLLVEDAETDYACVTLIVKIGNMYDTIPGIAHFLEHMLFNGTKKYPDENHFMSYISENGGSSNAFTAHDHTCYYYTIQPNMLIESLDIFSGFFESPLLKEDSVDREKEAVDAEHSKNKFSDMWRLNEILRHACVKSHPIRNFGTGSNRTLGIPNIHKHVKDFFENHYSSDLMTLVVIGRDSINDMKRRVMETFSNVPLQITKQNRTKYGGKVLDCPKLIKVVPIENVEMIKMCWDIPSFYNTPMASPVHFISHILGHEGKGTIHYLLYNHGYISKLTSGPFQFVFDRCIFQIDITLTDKGKEHRDDIICVVMAYINLLRLQIHSEHLKNLYDELLTLDAFEFKYMTKCGAEDRALSFCKLISEYEFDLKDILILPYAGENYEPNVKNNMDTVLNELTLDKVVITLVSSTYVDECTLEDIDYGTKYNIYPVIPKMNCSVDITGLSLPILNPYVSTGEELISLAYEKPVILPDIKSQLFWLPTGKFLVPNACVIIKINLPLSDMNKLAHTKSRLYVNSILAAINYNKYLCETAGYQIDISMYSGKLVICVTGNYKKIVDVCKFLSDSLLNKALITREIFDTVKFTMKKADTNIVFKPPYYRLGSHFSKKMCDKYYDNNDRLSVIDTITVDDVRNVINEILDISRLTIFGSGNITDATISEINDVFKHFVPRKIYESDIILSELYNTPSSSNEIQYYKVENGHETDCAMSYYVFIDKIKYGVTKDWNKTICLSNIVDSLIGTEYFDRLRTKEKTGYVVSGGVQTFGDKKCLSRYYVFTTQSPHKTAKQMIERTDSFLGEIMTDKILASTQNDINKIVESFVAILESPYNNINELASYIFQFEIETEYFSFDMKKVLINTYKMITVGDIIDFYNTYFIAKKKSISIGINGNLKN